MSIALDNHIAGQISGHDRAGSPGSVHAGLYRQSELSSRVGAEARALVGLAVIFGVLAPLAQLGSGLVWLGRRLEQLRPAV